MPVKILDNSGTTSIDNGTIKLADLEKMIIDFRQNVMIAGMANSGYVVPKHSFYFAKSHLKALLDGNPDADAIGITLAVQLPGSIVSCFDSESLPTTTDTSNAMVAVVSCATKSSLSSFNNVGDSVLINGYKPNAGGGADPNCCPNTKP